MSSKENSVVVVQNDNTKTLYAVFHFMVSIFAIYLSFKCNNKLDILSLGAAIIFPYFYILYQYAVSPNFCSLKNTI